jgi:uncharacterized membrane protein YgcG
MRPRRGRLAGGLGAIVVGAWLAMAGAATAAPPAGPPYPAPVTGQRVYDYAGIFSAGAVAQAEATIAAIEARTGAQVAVYAQVKPQSETIDQANADALALMNQWGVGRKGFDDGLVILFDTQSNLRHVQVSLYAGSGFKSSFLTNADRQAIFDNDMKPLLANGDLDGALRAALGDVNAAATPEHAAQLDQARVLNALVGLGALALAVVLIAFVLFRWYRHGRDPFYLDDDSVLMPAPPDGLTPAMATLIMDDRTSNRTVSAGMVDLAARGVLQFRQEDQKKTSLGVTGKPVAGSSPEGTLLAAVTSSAGSDGFVAVSSMPDLAGSVGQFKNDIESLSVLKGWLTGRPSTVVAIWFVIGAVEAAASIPLFVWSFALEASGGILGGAALVVAGVVTCIISWFMPCRTIAGAMLRAMLAAYRRTLQYTMQQAQSMQQVADSRAVPWIDTPDKAMAWGVALGLDREIDGVLHRSLEADGAAGRPVGWYPMWWIPLGGHSSGHGGGFGGGTTGLYSASMIPDVGSMMSAIGSIGASTSHSSGGSFGGGGGGGGGGAGGGF